MFWAIALLGYTQPKSEAIDFYVCSFEDVHGNTIEYKIDESRYGQQPSWDPNSNNPPPLELSKAISISRSWLESEYPEFELDDLHNAVLSYIAIPVGYTATSKKWFYMIRMNARPKSLSARAINPVKGMIGVVLMDGTVVKPKRNKVENK